MKFKEINVFEKPRERVKEVGIENLTNTELLCLLIRCGTQDKDVMSLSSEVLNLINSQAPYHNLTIEELMMINGIGASKATIILAAIELGKRLNSKTLDKKKFISPLDIYNHYHLMFKSFTQEHLYALYLNTKGNLLDAKLIGIGTINSVNIDTQEIFKWAFKLKATAFILVHNHPSGDETPSSEDLKMTIEIKKQAEILKLIILDHVIIGDYYYSMRNENHIF